MGRNGMNFDFFHKYLKARAKLYRVNTETYLTSVLCHDLRRDPKEVMDHLFTLHWLSDAKILYKPIRKKDEDWLKFFSQFQKKVIQKAAKKS